MARTEKVPVTVRISPDVHAALAAIAPMRNMSISKLMEEYTGNGAAEDLDKDKIKQWYATQAARIDAFAEKVRAKQESYDTQN